MARRGARFTVVAALVMVGSFPVAGAAGAEGGVVGSPPLTVVCGADGVSIVDSPVEAQADGVHLSLVNETERVRHVRVRPGRMLLHVGPGESVDEVLDLAPGTYRFLCKKGRFGKIPYGLPVAGVVEDPAGYFHPSEVECDGSVSFMIIDYASDAPGMPGEPAEIFAELVRGTLPDDVVDYTGYPEAAYPTAGVTRDGTLIAEASFFESSRGGWLLEGFESCVGNGLRLRFG